ncbi:MAG: hypothetical protein ACR2MY_07690, partial [Candidatus Dormibacteria bacterium]
MSLLPPPVLFPRAPPPPHAERTVVAVAGRRRDRRGEAYSLGALTFTDGAGASPAAARGARRVARAARRIGRARRGGSGLLCPTLAASAAALGSARP